MRSPVIFPDILKQNNKHLSWVIKPINKVTILWLIPFPVLYLRDAHICYKTGLKKYFRRYNSSTTF